MPLQRNTLPDVQVLSQKIIAFEFWGTIPRTDSLAFDEPFTHSETKAKMQQHLPCRFCLQLIRSIWAI